MGTDPTSAETDPTKKIQISTFVKLIRQSVFSRKKTYSGYRKNDTNVLRVLAMELFSKRGSTKDFEFCLGIACKTGNVEEVINIIRNRLQLIGLGHNLVPSMRNVQRSTASLVNHFLALCNHKSPSLDSERTWLHVYN